MAKRKGEEPTDPEPATGSARKRKVEPSEKKPRKKVRERISGAVMRNGFMRRRYIKRVLKYIDKSKAKGRELPPEMQDMARFLEQMPKPQRAKRLEEAILAQQTGDESFNRELRRAAANQQRRSGKGAGGYRPGSPPRSMQQGPRPSKKPR